MDPTLMNLMERPQNFEIFYSNGEFYLIEKETVSCPHAQTCETKKCARAKESLSEFSAHSS